MTPTEIRAAVEQTRRHFDSAILTPADGDKVLDLVLAVLELVVTPPESEKRK